MSSSGREHQERLGWQVGSSICTMLFAIERQDSLPAALHTLTTNRVEMLQGYPRRRWTTTRTYNYCRRLDETQFWVSLVRRPLEGVLVVFGCSRQHRPLPSSITNQGTISD